MVPIRFLLFRRRPLKKDIIDESDISHLLSSQGVHNHVTMVSYPENEKWYVDDRNRRLGGHLGKPGGGGQREDVNDSNQWKTYPQSYTRVRSRQSKLVWVLPHIDDQQRSPAAQTVDYLM